MQKLSYRCEQENVHGCSSANWRWPEGVLSSRNTHQQQQHHPQQQHNPQQQHHPQQTHHAANRHILHPEFPLSLQPLVFLSDQGFIWMRPGNMAGFNNHLFSRRGRSTRFYDHRPYHHRQQRSFRHYQHYQYLHHVTQREHDTRMNENPIPTSSTVDADVLHSVLDLLSTEKQMEPLQIANTPSSLPMDWSLAESLILNRRNDNSRSSPRPASQTEQEQNSPPESSAPEPSTFEVPTPAEFWNCEGESNHPAEKSSEGQNGWRGALPASPSPPGIDLESVPTTVETFASLCLGEQEQIVDMLREVNLRHDRQLRQDRLRRCCGKSSPLRRNEHVSAEGDHQEAKEVKEEETTDEDDDEECGVVLLLQRHPPPLPPRPLLAANRDLNIPKTDIILPNRETDDATAVYKLWGNKGTYDGWTERFSKTWANFSGNIFEEPVAADNPQNLKSEWRSAIAEHTDLLPTESSLTEVMSEDLKRMLGIPSPSESEKNHQPSPKFHHSDREITNNSPPSSSQNSVKVPMVVEKVCTLNHERLDSTQKTSNIQTGHSEIAKDENTRCFQNLSGAMDSKENTGLSHEVISSLNNYNKESKADIVSPLSHKNSLRYPSLTLVASNTVSKPTSEETTPIFKNRLPLTRHSKDDTENRFVDVSKDVTLSSPDCSSNGGRRCANSLKKDKICGNERSSWADRVDHSYRVRDASEYLKKVLGIGRTDSDHAIVTNVTPDSRAIPEMNTEGIYEQDEEIECPRSRDRKTPSKLDEAKKPGEPKTTDETKNYEAKKNNETKKKNETKKIDEVKKFEEARKPEEIKTVKKKKWKKNRKAKLPEQQSTTPPQAPANEQDKKTSTKSVRPPDAETDKKASTKGVRPIYVDTDKKVSMKSVRSLDTEIDKKISTKGSRPHDGETDKRASTKSVRPPDPDTEKKASTKVVRSHDSETDKKASARGVRPIDAEPEKSSSVSTCKFESSRKWVKPPWTGSRLSGTWNQTNVRRNFAGRRQTETSIDGQNQPKPEQKTPRADTLGDSTMLIDCVSENRGTRNDVEPIGRKTARKFVCQYSFKGSEEQCEPTDNESETKKLQHQGSKSIIRSKTNNKSKPEVMKEDATTTIDESRKIEKGAEVNSSKDCERENQSPPSTSKQMPRCRDSETEKFVSKIGSRRANTTSIKSEKKYNPTVPCSVRTQMGIRIETHSEEERLTKAVKATPHQKYCREVENTFINNDYGESSASKKIETDLKKDSKVEVKQETKVNLRLKIKTQLKETKMYSRKAFMIDNGEETKTDLREKDKEEHMIKEVKTDLGNETSGNSRLENERNWKLESEQNLRKEIDPDISLVSKPDLRVESEKDSRKEIDPGITQDSMPDIRAECEPDLRVESEADIKVESEADLGIEIDPGITQDSMPDTRVECEPDLRVKSEADLRIENELDYRVESESDLSVECEHDLRVESKPDHREESVLGFSLKTKPDFEEKEILSTENTEKNICFCHDSKIPKKTALEFAVEKVLVEVLGEEPAIKEDPMEAARAVWQKLVSHHSTRTLGVAAGAVIGRALDEAFPGIRQQEDALLGDESFHKMAEEWLKRWKANHKRPDDKEPWLSELFARFGQQLASSAADFLEAVHVESRRGSECSVPTNTLPDSESTGHQSALYNSDSFIILILYILHVLF